MKNLFEYLVSAVFAILLLLFAYNQIGTQLIDLTSNIFPARIAEERK